jgi:hypothetical protein
MITLSIEELFIKFVDSDEFIILYRLKDLGHLLKSKQSITTQFAKSLDTDIYNFLSDYFNLEYADKITLEQLNRKLYGYKTGLYYMFITFFVSYYYRTYYVIPHASTLLKYNVGLEEALLFWPNISSSIVDIRKSIVNAMKINQLISSVRKVNPYIIKEVDEFMDVKKVIGIGSQDALNKIAKYDKALAIAFIVQSLSYKILLDLGKNVETLIGLDVYKNLE